MNENRKKDKRKMSQRIRKSERKEVGKVQRRGRNVDDQVKKKMMKYGKD